MHCYQHEAQTAHGICKSCNKALCKECAVEADMAITCKGECEEYNAMVYNTALVSSHMQKRMARPNAFGLSRVTGWFGLFIGIASGGFFYYTKDSDFIFLTVLGLSLALFSFIQNKRTQSLFKPGEDS